MKNILIFGASGHAKMIIDIIQLNKNYNIKGFVDSYKPINEVVVGFNVLGDLEQLPSLIKELDIEGIVVGIGDNYTREVGYHKIKEIAPQLEFVTVIHPSAIIAENVTIGAGTVIMSNTVINASAKVGKLCIINTASNFGHDSIMSDFSSLAPGVITGGGVQIGLGSAICLGALIIHNISIGDHTVIGSGSLVIKSIGNFKKAFGSPISIIKDREVDSKYLG